MKEYKVTWMKKFDLMDLGIAGVNPGESVLLSEKDLIRSKDFKKARQVGAVSAQEHKVDKSLVIGQKLEVDLSQIEGILSDTFQTSLAPLYETQERIIEVLEKISNMKVSGTPREELSSKKEYFGVKEPELESNFTFEDVNITSEVKKDTSESKDITDSLKKLRKIKIRKK